MGSVGEEHGRDWGKVHGELIVNKVLAGHMCTEMEVSPYCV